MRARAWTVAAAQAPIRVLLSLLAAAPAVAQESGDPDVVVPTPALPGTVQLRHLEPRSLGGRCGAGAANDPTLAEVRAILAEPVAPDAEARLHHLHDSLAAAVGRRPDDLSALYGLALVLGARSEVSGGRDKLRFADAMQSRARRLLELDPEHAGARHLLGRLHAAVRRMSGLKRVLARTLFGGDVLEAASWESARAHLEAAEDGAPCVPDHHFELARLYADQGEVAAALREVGHVLQLTGGGDGDGGVGAKAMRLARELGGGPTAAVAPGEEAVRPPVREEGESHDPARSVVDDGPAGAIAELRGGDLSAGEQAALDRSVAVWDPPLPGGDR